MSRQDFFDNPGFEDARELFFQAIAVIGQPLVVQPQNMQHRGVPVRDADFVLDGSKSDLVGASVTECH